MRRVFHILGLHAQKQRTKPIARALNGFGNRKDTPPLYIIHPIRRPFQRSERMSDPVDEWRMNASVPYSKVVRVVHHLQLYPKQLINHGFLSCRRESQRVVQNSYPKRCRRQKRETVGIKNRTDGVAVQHLILALEQRNQLLSWIF